MGNSGMRPAWQIQVMILALLSGLTFSCTLKTTRRAISSPDPIKIQDIRVAEGVDKTIIELESEEPILYTSFRLSDPDRLVIEMADVTFGQYQDKIKVSEGPVRSIMLASSGELDVSRLEFELNGLVKTEVRPDGLNIVVEVTRLEKMTGLGQTPQVEPMHKKSFIFFGDKEKKPPTDLTAKNETGPVREEPIEPPADTATPSLPALVTPSPPPLVPKLTPEVTPSASETPVEMSSKETGTVKKMEPTPPPRVIEQPKPIATSPAKMVKGVRFVEGKTLQLVVSSDGRLSPDIFFVGKNKKRLVIDFPGVKTEMKQNQIPGDAFFVKQIRIGKHPKKLRLVLDLNEPVVFAWAQKQNELWVTLK